MGKTLAQLVAVVRQKTNTDGTGGGNQVVTDPELAGYINEAIRSLYDLIVGVDSSYYQGSYDFTLSSSATGNAAALPDDFYKERGLVIFPDTERETPVFFKPFAERLRGGLGATLDGNSVRVFPWQLAGQGPWRLYYTPKAATLDAADFQVRVAFDFGSLAAVVSGPSGPGRTLTASVNGALVCDALAMNAGDRILMTGSPDPPDDAGTNGIWVVITPGSASSKWVLVRATDYDQALPTEIRVGATIYASEGALYAGSKWALTAFAGIVETSVQTYTRQQLPSLDVTMSNFDEYITNKAALAVYAKRQMDPGIIPALFSAAEQRVNSMASMRIAEPEQAPILWRQRNRRSYYDDIE